jgi:hypothetical protein
MILHTRELLKLHYQWGRNLKLIISNLKIKIRASRLVSKLLNYQITHLLNFHDDLSSYMSGFTGSLGIGDLL